MTTGIRTAILAACAAAGHAAAQCSDWRSGPMSLGHLDGVDDRVYASTVWDPDGAGPEAPILVVGGGFSSAGGVPAGRIAAWDGYYWRGLDEGVVGPVAPRIESLAVHNGVLAAGGWFTTAGTTPAASIARWDGTAWQPYGAGLNGTVRDLTVFNGELAAGGYFTMSGATLVNHVARWNGSSWQPFGVGVPVFVSAVAVYNGSLIVAGWNSQGVAPVLRWNGSSWAPLGSGMIYAFDPQFTSVEDLIVYNGELVATGTFTSAGGVSANYIARWNGSVWQPLGAGITGALPGNSHPFVFALGVYGNDLFAGGFFTQAGGAAALCLARWNGSQWIPAVNLPVPAPLIESLAVYNGELVAAGEFEGLTGMRNIARFDGASWSELLRGPEIHAFATLGDRLVVAGQFQEPTSEGFAHRIASWDGVDLAPLDTGFTGEVRALESFVHSAPPFDQELIAGGFFTGSGATPVNHVARWIESPFIAFPPPEWEPMGAGFNEGVLALERFNGGTYAGGHFTASGLTAINHLARWDEPSQTWKPVGTGTNGPVRALRAGAVAPNSIELIAGGNFSAAGGVSAENIARWVVNPIVVGSGSWSAMGAGFNGVVQDIERHQGSTYAAGNFTKSGTTTVNRVARWTGSAWVEVGGGMDGPVHALKSYNGVLYAAGEFYTAGGTPARGIARWNGISWSPVMGGVQGIVRTLHAFKGEIQAGGEFGTVRNGAVESPGWARFLADGLVWIAVHPQSATRPCGTNFNPDVQAAAGYTGLSFQWRKDGVPLVNGPTGTGSTIVGATGNLVVQDVGLADEGAYDCVITGCGGSAVSHAATLTVTGCCYPDCNTDGALTVADFGCFQTRFVAGNAYADCNQDGVLTVADFGCFQTRFVAGCP